MEHTPQPTDTAVPANGITQKNRDLFTRGEKNDRCMVTEVRNHLASNGLLLLVPNFDNNKYVKDAEGLPAQGQMHLLNRFWNAQLMVNPAVTQEARFYLNNTLDPQHWMDVFQHKVILHCLDLRLPHGPHGGQASVQQLIH